MIVWSLLFPLFLTGAAVETGGLNRMISDRDLAVIARDHLSYWGSLAPFLGLTETRQQQIARSYPGDYARQGRECLQVWREMKGSEATYQALISAAVEARDQQLADAVKDLCLSSHGRRAEDRGEKYLIFPSVCTCLFFHLFCSIINHRHPHYKMQTSKYWQKKSQRHCSIP